MAKNRRITLASRPVGFPAEADFNLDEVDIPAPGDGECLVRTAYMSVDPYMRGRMNDRKSYSPPVQIGAVMVGGAVGKVIESNSPDIAVGDYVNGNLGWQEYALAAASELRKVDPDIAPISTAVGVLGMPGLTAYFGLLEVCDPQPGETVFVSGAAGAVGSLVGQIAKIKGCRAVGLAGTDEKARHCVEDLGFDVCLNYKTIDNYYAKFAEICAGGVDCYFDNVGGDITDAVFPLLNVHARVSICGQISQYNLKKPEMGPRLFWHLIVKQAKVQGFLVFNYQDRYDEGLRQMAAWIKEGKLHYRETVAEGIENAPRAFISMLSGANTGKQLVKLSDV